MSDQPAGKKSRRRFLADMLFVGGGVTAAALLAKSKLIKEVIDPPRTVGEMIAPVAQPSPQHDAKQTPEQCPTTPGEPAPQLIDGDYALPEASPSPHMTTKGEAAPPIAPHEPPPPKTGGKPVAPRPNPDSQS